MKESAPENYCVALQPICDGALRHVADELLYRAGVNARYAQVDDDMMVTARVCNAAFYETGIEKLVGRRKLFFNAPREWLLRPELLPPDSSQVVVEVLESVTGEPAVIEALRRIRRLGYEVALDDFVLTPATRPLLEVASVVKVDMLQPLRLDDILLYRNRGIRLLAEKVEDMETFERCRALGFELFQGYFYARPEVQTSTARDRTGNRQAQLRILAELQREAADYHKLESLIIQDPQLAFMLLRYTNSAMFYRFSKAVTILQAINMLGLHRVRTVVLTLMLANNGPASRLLLPQVLTRAAMCERLAEKMGGVPPEVAFMAGMISMMDVILGLSLADILEALPLGQDVNDALLHRSQCLGQVLDMVEAFEQAQTAGLDPEMVARLNRTWMSSRVWATEILSAVGA
ncbi:EAL and HDOD domain-containing protein [Corticimicrobacter populi]|uniref:Diguanylate phosphodiesterase n=1 Tax=Corticimicrobacter populi TaxID=2175229 RepID=A0A2V1K388_9BURK|nr:HDOD domain-containing protein [Corticimicrobacter populi]PWF24683.1 diguanylate phosphodiesterase [Corticimicrobacter populi]